MLERYFFLFIFTLFCSAFFPALDKRQGRKKNKKKEVVKILLSHYAVVLFSHQAVLMQPFPTLLEEICEHTLRGFDVSADVY